MDDSTLSEADIHELLGWAEFVCWTALLLAPLIYWLQGPSVSNDQFVVRTALVVLAAAGAVILRASAIIRRFQSRASLPRDDASLHDADRANHPQQPGSSASEHP